MAFSYKDYVESQKVQDLYKQLSQQEAAKPSDWTGGTYGQAMQDALSAIQNRKKFSYDLNGDALYQQYKDRYVQQGKQAMQDTMGQAAALTGGYGSTYSQSAGQQQYNAYLQSLNDVVPELYQLALNRYQMEGDDLQTQYALLADQYNTEYGQYRDSVSDWQSYRDYLANRYDAERDTDYTMYGDAKNFAYQDYRDEIADQQWQQQYEESIRQFNEQMALSREQFAWQQAQAAAAGQSSGSSSGSSGSSSSGSSSGGSDKSSGSSTGTSSGGDMTWQEFMKRMPSQAAYGANSASYQGYIERQIDKYSDRLSDADVKKLIEVYGLG